MNAKRAAINLENYKATVEQSIFGADELRKDRIGALHAISVSRAALQQSELARLQKKYGDDHPRVAEAAERARAGAVTVRALNLEAERVELRVPDAQKDRYTVFGVVRDAKDNPLDDVLLQLVTADGNPVTEPVSTDNRAGFVLKLDMAAAQVPKTKAESAAARQLPGMGVQIEVLHFKTKKRLALDTVVLVPSAGIVDYREVVVGAHPLKKSALRRK